MTCLAEASVSNYDGFAGFVVLPLVVHALLKAFLAAGFARRAALVLADVTFEARGTRAVEGGAIAAGMARPVIRARERKALVWGLESEVIL